MTQCSELSISHWATLNDLLLKAWESAVCHHVDLRRTAQWMDGHYSEFQFEETDAPFVRVDRG